MARASIKEIRAGLGRRLSEPRDAAGLAAFRVAFGLLMFASSVRFLANGWVERFYIQPRFFFSYWGLSFIRPLATTGELASGTYVVHVVRADGRTGRTLVVRE